jgi:tetratricopeptide (TPR) repeat protein
MVDREADYLETLTKAELAELQKEYDQLLEQAEEEYNNEQFLNALDGYQAASRIFPKEQYPKDRIAEINDLLGLMMVAEEMQQALAERLQSLLKQGDLQFEREQFEEAKNSYQRALSINSENQHAKNRIEEIHRIMDQQQADQQYKELITQADNAFDELLYKEAQSGYEQAIELKQDEPYPKERLREVNDILSKQAENAEKQQSYEEAIFQAELNFEKQFYEEAISFYEKALTFIPGDEKATSKIQEIKDLMYELANRTLYDRLIKTADRAFKRDQFEEALADYQQAVDLFPEEEWPNEQITKINEVLETRRTFARLISQADVAFDEERYGNSKNFYQQALEIKPEDEHATQRIAEIDEIFAQQNLEEQYSELIAEADNFFETDELEQAKTKYQEALSVKSGEKYPEDRIEEIDRIFEERAQLEERYQNAVAVADQLFQGEELEQARDAYENAAGIKPSETYPPEMIQRIDSLVAESERLLAEQKAAEEAAEQARLEAEARAREQRFQQIVDEADRMVNENELVAAIGKFREALDVKPQEQYPIVRIEEIRGMISRQQEAQEAYENAISQADRDFRSEEFDAARSGYNQAKQAKPEETYPDEMIAQIDSIVETRARLAAEAEAAEQARLAAIQAEKDRNYNNAVSRGDSLFNLEEYEPSRTAYREALQVKPEETYPQERIDEIDQILSEMELARLKQEQLEREYQNAIRAADQQFENQQYNESKGSYTKASGIKPEENYPKEQIATIDNILEQRKLEEQYRTIILAADGFFRTKSYDQARSKYEEALEVKPGEDYPKNQIAKIDDILSQEQERVLAEQQSAADLERRRQQIASQQEEIEEMEMMSEADLNDLYQEYIQRADQFFDNESYNVSRAWYYRALDVKPDETYPPERIAEINRIVDGLLLSQRDRDYQQFIDLADSTFRDNQLAVARGWYNRALSIKSNEAYPRNQLQEIQNRIEERMANQSGELFNEHVKKGDDAFENGNYNVARFWYKKALELRPNDEEVKNKIQQIQEELN